MDTLLWLIRGGIILSIYLAWFVLGIVLPAEVFGRYWVEDPWLAFVLVPGSWLLLAGVVLPLVGFLDRNIRTKEGRLSARWTRRQKRARKNNLVKKAMVVRDEFGDEKSFDDDLESADLSIVRPSGPAPDHEVRVMWNGEVVFEGSPAESTTMREPERVVPTDDGEYEVRDGRRRTYSGSDEIEVYHRGAWEKRLQRLYHRALRKREARERAEQEIEPSREEKLRKKLGG